MTDVTKQLAEQWRAMNAADKKPYEVNPSSPPFSLARRMSAA